MRNLRMEPKSSVSVRLSIVKELEPRIVVTREPGRLHKVHLFPASNPLIQSLLRENSLLYGVKSLCIGSRWVRVTLLRGSTGWIPITSGMAQRLDVPVAPFRKIVAASPVRPTAPVTPLGDLAGHEGGEQGASRLGGAPPRGPWRGKLAKTACFFGKSVSQTAGAGRPRRLPKD